MSIINIISEEGYVEAFQKKNIADVHSLEKGVKLLVKTYDEKELVGIYITFDKKWESLKLQSQHNEIILNIPLKKVMELYQKV